MELVYKTAKNELKLRREAIMATVVKTSGSTPQKPGARLLVKSDGSAVGTLGGGCVEGDIWFLAKEILKSGRPAELRDYELNEDLAAKDGLVCGGTMHFLIDPIRNDSSEFVDYMSEVINAYNGGKPVALAQLLNTQHKPSVVGQSLLIREDGTVSGSLGSISTDQDAVKKAKHLLALGRNSYVKAANGDEYYIEAYTTPPNLILVGGGHISNALAPLAKTLGFRIFVVDDRKEFSNKNRFPEADKTLVSEYGDGIKTLVKNANTFVIVATRGHRHDDDAVAAALSTQASYVGLVGSKRKAILIFEKLISEGFSEKQINSVHSPIGLNIGARTPEEIAVSIMSEILSFRFGGAGTSMKLDDSLMSKSIKRGNQKKAGSSIAIE